MFDQTYLPISIPLFQSLFAANGILHVVELLKMNQAMNIVFLCKSVCDLFPMFMNSSHQIVCDTNVQRSADAAGENVNPEIG